MKRKGNAFAPVVALVILVAAWLLAESMAGRLQKEPEAENAAEPILLGAGMSADIRGLSWNYGGQTVELVWDKDRAAWVNGEDYACPIDQEAVEPLVEAASGVNALMAIQRVTDYVQYGLETPILSLTVSTADHSVSYEIGNQTLTGEYYLRVDGTDTVYTETGLLLPAFQIMLEDLLVVETGPQDVARMTRLSVETDVTGYEVSFREAVADDWFGEAYDWTVRVDEEAPVPLETEWAEALCRLVTGIEFEACVDWNGEASAVYGLDRPQGTASVTYGTEENGTETFTLVFGNYKDEYVYVRIDGSDVVYLAEGAVLDGLMYPDWETMTPRTVCPIDMTQVFGAEVHLGGHTYEIDRHVEAKEAADANGDPVMEELVCYVSNGWTLNAEAAEAWFGNIGALSWESVAGDVQGREEMFSVAFRRDSETWSEVTLTLWSYDSTRWLATVNGEESYFIARGDGEELVAQGEALLIME